ncbi:MAG: putative glycoside hydrolase [Acidimicrobiia bacterium]
MNRVTRLLLCGVVVASCTAEPGGGGVNIATSTMLPPVPGPSTTLAPTTTSSTAPRSTTTTVPVLVVDGSVERSSGVPVAGATIAIGDQQVSSGPDGSFSLETTDPGAISVTKLGWTTAQVPWEEWTGDHIVTIDQATIRGLRVSPAAAADDVHFSSLLTLADGTAVNALVFDTKREGGEVVYDTDVIAARDSGAVNAIYDPAARVGQAHALGLYTITRIVTFEDSRRVGAFPDEKLAGAWLDPVSAGAREYNLALAEEACELGFDEIQFDYVRYPTGQTATISGQLDLTQEERVAAIAGFLSEARHRLEPKGCSVSAAIFGIVTSSPTDQGLGQRPEELSAETHVLSPMVYPSHYSPGWLGLDDPNSHPYEVTSGAIADALARMTGHSQLRPWLQGFWWSNEQIRRSIDAAEDLGVGWILWNIRSNYDLAALPTDEEVGG